MPPRKKSKLCIVQDSPSPSPSPESQDQVEQEERFHFPSVRLQQPLIDTYTFHSVDHTTTTPAEGDSKGKERANDQEEEGKGEEWMLGVDEAGRGPALGK